MSLVAQLAWRFRSGKRQNGFISFISASSTLGIALGCMVLILLLSVMNGFERELKNQLLSYIPHGEIYAYEGTGLEKWQEQLNRLSSDPRITSIEPYIKASGLLQKGNKMKAVPELVGIDLHYAQNNRLVQQVGKNHWANFKADPNSVLLGRSIMQQLAVNVGDKVQLVLPQISDDLSFSAPKTVWLNVAGEIAIGGELDSQIGFMHIKLAADTLGTVTGAQGLRFRFDDPFIANSAIREFGFSFTQHVFMSDWMRTQGHLYQDIQLVRAVVYVALTLVIGVACFNIISTLVMAVSEKRAEIAMLKTMGARDKLIIQVFVLQGAVNGIIGTLVGVICGVLLAEYLTPIAIFIENVSGVKFLSGDVYFIDFLPSQLRWSEVFFTALIAICLSLLATIYPAFKATKINPAEALGQH
ncbi:lipoprotein-releasing ABC transporter permease subunit [Aliiglaciecola sp. 2_MG-2023]|uniref:lipoprotein-releasing ABC transporter permease subunit n=1 Tax=Alteromonadaceae TaxID=72275 RepID=UPI0026E3F33B|nr:MULTISPECIES: lipoprotein-releasing ABC transporter permease subunit [unclassified Aliiglaciecola]MDO6710431.1 lipoprotein-releasing ABC transporter permease subunit [Aliiglaciecola sp. 2_MG-2023]MDO6751704.1 lipoprotein-releasing ABC transporter permease subunit [Aliiglaciecola sp. 1_MG-2023]